MTINILAVGGGDLAYEVSGGGPLVICSPAVGDTRDAFASLAEQLIAQGYRVARADLRGHGDSSARFSRYGDEATADDLLAVLAVLDALGGGPAVLMGASLSAGAAVIAAGRRPDQVAGLVLIAPFLRNGAGRAMRRVMRVAFARPWGPTLWREFAARLWPGLGAQARERAASTTALLTRPGRWPAFHATLNTDHSVVTPWIDRVRAPVLVIMGDADPDWKDPMAEAQWVASSFADAELVTVPGAGHAPMLECPDSVGPAVAAFLDRLSKAGAFSRGHV